ncbi:RNI-like protein [Hesseltinella vesiculosa]|uniref:RNI-like protein n=1 Tax=Hesseltinella vesiculosa TaxID=101127 RepID=A0A1X2GIU5_9FUNG|nr:RNI-like protein [Hesseltinella vesiculosa]
MVAPINEYTLDDNTVFSIQGKGLKLNTSDDVKDFVDTIMQMDNLQEIRLSGNTLGVEASETLAAALKSRSTLKVAALSDIFTGRLLSEIPLALKALCDAFENTSLEELDLSDNAFGPAGAEPLIDFLSNCKTLRVLRLNNNGLGIGGGTMIAKALQANADKARAENRPSSLHTIICGRNRLEDGSSKALATAFASHGTLRVVRMPQNGIRPDGIKNIVQGLSKCDKLQHLDLQDNTFTAKGSQALADTLGNWPELTILNVSDCLLGKKGGIALAESLEKGQNARLTHLHLQYNEITAPAIITLAGAIKKHLKDLTLLELNGNRFDADEQEAKILLEALAEWDHEDALDELDDMEELDSDEESEEEEDEVVEEADEEAAAEPVVKNQDKEEDVLVQQLNKTHI